MVISPTEPVFLRSSRVYMPRDLPPRPFHVLAGGGTCLHTVHVLRFSTATPDSSLQVELEAKQVEKALLARTTASREGELSRGRTRMKDLRGADVAIAGRK